MPRDKTIEDLQLERMRALKACKQNPADNSSRERAAQLKTQIAEKKLENYISKVVDESPPLSERQVAKLTALFSSVPADASGQARV